MKKVFWSIADNQNIKYFEMLKSSFQKFHLNEELLLIGEKEIQDSRDNHIFYRATPYFTKYLMEQGYDWVCKLDADQIVTGNLDHIWEEDYDVAVVNNSNPREMKQVVVRVWDIHPLSYINCGFVVCKSKRFVDHWLGLCRSSHFESYQYREQDLLNILVFYGDYKVKYLDNSRKWHGLISKGYWANIERRDNELWLPQNNEWPLLEDKQIVCLHYAGGKRSDKWRDLNIRFKTDVAHYLKKLTSG